MRRGSCGLQLPSRFVRLAPVALMLCKKKQKHYHMQKLAKSCRGGDSVLHHTFSTRGWESIVHVVVNQCFNKLVILWNCSFFFFLFFYILPKEMLHFSFIFDFLFRPVLLFREQKPQETLCIIPSAQGLCVSYFVVASGH